VGKTGAEQTGIGTEPDREGRAPHDLPRLHLTAPVFGGAVPVAVPDPAAPDPAIPDPASPADADLIAKRKARRAQARKRLMM